MNEWVSLSLSLRYLANCGYISISLSGVFWWDMLYYISYWSTRSLSLPLIVSGLVLTTHQIRTGTWQLMNCELLMKHNRQVYTCREHAPLVAACAVVTACAVVVGFDSLPTSCSNIPFNLIQVGHYGSQCVVYLMYCTCINTDIILASSEWGYVNTFIGHEICV